MAIKTEKHKVKEGKKLISNFKAKERLWQRKILELSIPFRRYLRVEQTRNCQHETRKPNYGQKYSRFCT